MSKFVVVMNRQCDFCQGIKGFCDKAEVRGKSCFGQLDNRPEWCPLLEVEEKDMKYMLVKSAKFREKRLWVNV